MAVGHRSEAELMRWLLIVALLAACTPAAAAPVQTEDPRVAVLQTQVDQLHAALDVAQNTPTFSMWNYTQVIPRGSSLRLGLPDTFTVRIRFTATSPVRTRIMSLDQFAQYMAGRAVDALTYPTADTLDVTFHDSEGCAAYVLVLDADRDVTVTPDVTITRAVHPYLTGVCAN